MTVIEVFLVIAFVGILFGIPILVRSRVSASNNRALFLRLIGGVMMLLLFVFEQDRPTWFVAFVVAMLMITLMDYYKSRKIVIKENSNLERTK